MRSRNRNTQNHLETEADHRCYSSRMKCLFALRLLILLLTHVPLIGFWQRLPNWDP